MVNRTKVLHGEYVAIERDPESFRFTVLEGVYPIRSFDRVVGVCKHDQIMKMVEDDAARNDYEYAVVHTHYPYTLIRTGMHTIVAPGCSVTLTDAAGNVVLKQRIPTKLLNTISSTVKSLIKGYNEALLHDSLRAHHKALVTKNPSVQHAEGIRESSS